VRESALTAVTQEKHVLFLCFDFLLDFFLKLFSFYPPTPPPHVVVVSFIGTAAAAIHGVAKSWTLLSD